MKWIEAISTKWQAILLGGVLVTACTQRVEIIPNYPGDEPVMNAFLTPDSTLTVWLTLTIPALTPAEPDTIPRIEDASVWILQDGDTLEQLSHTGEGYYRSLQGLKAKTGHSYRFVALLASGDTLTHLSVQVPPAVQPHALNYSPDAFPSLDFGNLPDLIRIEFDDPPITTEFYEVRLNPVEAPSARLNSIVSQGTDAALSTCEQYGGIFSDACLQAENPFLEIKVSPTYVDDSTRQQVRADSLILSLYTWSESYFLRSKTSTEGLDAFEQIFFNTATRYTNVIGGYGIIVARNEAKVRLATD